MNPPDTHTDSQPKPPSNRAAADHPPALPLIDVDMQIPGPAVMPDLRKIVAEGLGKRTGIVPDVDLWVSAVRPPQAFQRFLLKTDALHDMSFTLVTEGKTRWVEPKDLREAGEEWSKIANKVVGEKATTGEHLGGHVFSAKSDSEISLRQFESMSFERADSDHPLKAVSPYDPRVQQALKKMRVNDHAVDRAIEFLDAPLPDPCDTPQPHGMLELIDSLGMLSALSKASSNPIAGEIRKIIKLLLVVAVGKVDAEIGIGPIACMVTSLAALIVRYEQSGDISRRDGISETVCIISSHALLSLSLLDAHASAKRSFKPKTPKLVDICRDDWLECILCVRALPTTRPIGIWDFLERRAWEHTQPILFSKSAGRALIAQCPSEVKPPDLAINGTSVLRIGMACVAAVVCQFCSEDQLPCRQIRLTSDSRLRLGSAPPSSNCAPTIRRQ